ncbi:hypothetical protein FACS1894216_21570 [Synergistales bacterium]|nr:hypothetical protein FACS1894216_21570 [Synergistales bacterium]
MTRNEVITLVRSLISDEQASGFVGGDGNLEQPEGTNELLNYLDRAVDAWSEERSAANDIRFLSEFNVSDGDPLPSDFIRFAGLVPFDVTDNIIRYYWDVSPLRAKYYRRGRHFSAMVPEEETGYNLKDERRLAAMCAIYALNKHEFDVSQDIQLLLAGGASDGAGKYSHAT